MRPCPRCSCPLSNRASDCSACGWHVASAEVQTKASRSLRFDDHQSEDERSPTPFVVGWFVSRAILLVCVMGVAGGIGWFCNGTVGATIGVFLGAILCAAGFLSEFAG
jgi:hypothetical protein